MVFSRALVLLCATASWLSGLQSLRRNSLREQKFLGWEFFFSRIMPFWRNLVCGFCSEILSFPRQESDSRIRGILIVAESAELAVMGSATRGNERRRQLLWPGLGTGRRD